MLRRMKINVRKSSTFYAVLSLSTSIIFQHLNLRISAFAGSLDRAIQHSAGENENAQGYMQKVVSAIDVQESEQFTHAVGAKFGNPHDTEQKIDCAKDLKESRRRGWRSQSDNQKQDATDNMYHIVQRIYMEYCVVFADDWVVSKAEKAHQ